MKAIVYEEYGPPEVLKIEDVESPAPKGNELLVRVHATTVNFGDLLARNFKNTPLRKFYMPLPLWLPVRIAFGWNKPKVRILGSEFSGVVESVGMDVKAFKEGDEVFGYRGQRMGAYAEYLCIPENKMVGIKPKNMTHEEAACIPYGAIMAHDHLKRVKIRPGQKVLVNGASGAIGSAGVQIAKYHGAEVTGVCGTRGQDYVKALGADHVIDYVMEDFTTNGETYDVIYDILGKSTFSKCRNSLTDNGIYLNASFKSVKILQMIWTKIAGKKKVICAFASEKHEDMARIRELAEAGHFRSIIDRTFPLDRTAEAHRYVGDGRKRGSVVITVVPGSQA
ncbi:MAG: NAD(P)-dependent alcohol dehydrogenase [Candidatus Aminicenantes bacterium]|nr:NAD(P)-dependent alcohol dehydrogenase [Candidatus Aminicenantes bacterium]